MRTLILLSIFLASSLVRAESGDISSDEKSDRADEICLAFSNAIGSALILLDEREVAKVSGTVNVKTSHYHGTRLVDSRRKVLKLSAAYKKAYGEELSPTECEAAELPEEDLKRAMAFMAKAKE